MFELFCIVCLMGIAISLQIFAKPPMRLLSDDAHDWANELEKSLVFIDKMAKKVKAILSKAIPSFMREVLVKEYETGVYPYAVRGRLKHRMTDEEVDSIADKLQAILSAGLVFAVTGFALWASLQH
jgi:hypothetical protein